MKALVFGENELHIHHTYTPTPCESDFPLHTHDTCEIYCFLSGQGYYTVEGQDYPLTPGCVLVMRANETHKLHISADRPYERIALHFSLRPFKNTPYDELVNIFRKKALGRRNMLPAVPELTRVVDFLKRITQDGMTPQESRTALLAYLPAILYEINMIMTSLAEPKYTEKDSLVKNIIEYINNAPHQIDNVVVMEEIFGYSRSYLNRVFRASTGVPIWDYVILKRLTMARDLVRSGTPAATAAQISGFGDYSSFYRQYRKRFGITPERDRHLAGVELIKKKPAKRKKK